MKFFFLFLLLFSLFIPLGIRASCKSSSSESCPGLNCDNGCTYCRNGNGSIYACCNNNPVWDNCPYKGTTPTPGPGCGNNLQECCPGGWCRDADNTCYDIEDFDHRCLNHQQISVIEYHIAHPTDPTSRYCGSGTYPGINTAIGCIPTDPKGLVGLLVSWTAGIGGGIALLMIFYAGFVLTTAGGDLKKVSSAKTILTSAVIGLVIILLAVVILNFLGARIFNLDQIGFNV